MFPPVQSGECQGSTQNIHFFTILQKGVIGAGKRNAPHSNLCNPGNLWFSCRGVRESNCSAPAEEAHEPARWSSESVTGSRPTIGACPSSARATARWLAPLPLQASR